MSESATSDAQELNGERKGPQLVAESTGLKVNSVGKSFKRRPVVRNVSLHLRRNEVVGLLGPNGAGKTTCFYMITGLMAADYGTIELDGVDITRLPMYRRARLGIGYLPQEASIFRGLTVEENIRSVVELVEPDPERREIDHRLAPGRVRHQPFAPGAGAGTFGRRAAARRDRALAGHQSVVHAARRAFRGHRPDRDRRYPRSRPPSQGRGIGVLITDHNVRETLDIIDRAYIMHDGQVLDGGRTLRGRRQCGCTPRLSRRPVHPLGAQLASSGL